VAVVATCREAGCKSRTASHANSAGATDPTSIEPAAHTPGVSPAKTSDVAATETPDVAATETSNMGSAEAASRVCARDRQSSGEDRAGQNHHPAFQHGMLLFAFGDQFAAWRDVVADRAIDNPPVCAFPVETNSGMDHRSLADVTAFVAVADRLSRTSSRQHVDRRQQWRFTSARKAMSGPLH
jgi:hypothetical protein